MRKILLYTMLYILSLWEINVYHEHGFFIEVTLSLCSTLIMLYLHYKNKIDEE